MNPHGWHIKFTYNLYNMGDIMIRDEYWDEIEYNFFKDLDDEDKLLYLYDLMIGDFSDEYYGEIEFDFEEDSDEIRQEVLATFDESGHISITGSSKDTLTKVAMDMVMNGLILSDKVVSETQDGGYLLQYKIIGNSTPISVN